MSLTSKIMLNPRHTKKNGHKTIIIRLTLNRKSIEITTGYSVNPKYWNEAKSEIKSNCPDVENVTRLNKRIRHMRVQIEDKVIGLQESGALKTLSLSALKKELSDKKKESTLLHYTDELIKELELGNKVGNARVYKTLRRSLDDFLNGKDLPLRSVNFKFLKSYEAWYLSKGNTINGLSVYLRTLRAILNRAIKEDLLAQDQYAFKNYKIKKESTKKRAITASDMKLFMQYEPNTKQKQRAKDTFLMSFYLMGASFVDLAFLKLKNIVDDRIEYRRKKTGQLYSIKITKPLFDILNRYTQDKGGDDFILNVITKEELPQQKIQVRDELKRVNKRLKEIGKECGITQPLTSYVARHTYASLANNKNVPLSAISQALGHKDQKTTSIYLAELNNEALDEYHEMIIDN